MPLTSEAESPTPLLRTVRQYEMEILANIKWDIPMTWLGTVGCRTALLDVLEQYTWIWLAVVRSVKKELNGRKLETLTRPRLFPWFEFITIFMKEQGLSSYFFTIVFILSHYCTDGSSGRGPGMRLSLLETSLSLVEWKQTGVLYVQELYLQVNLTQTDMGKCENTNHPYLQYALHVQRPTFLWRLGRRSIRVNLTKSWNSEVAKEWYNFAKRCRIM